MLLNLKKSGGVDNIEYFSGFKNNIEIIKEDFCKFLKESREAGKKVYGYGASTKGNVLLQYCDVTRDDLIAIAEVNPDKFGHVTPGTNIPIISENEARECNPDFFVVLPWHFRENILEKEKEYIKRTGCKFVFPLPKVEIVTEEDL